MAGREAAALEPERRSFGSSPLGSLLLHGILVGSIFLYVWWMHRVHGIEWGNQQPIPGAISATMVSSAPTLPLPQEQTPTQNVLATETPSPAPAEALQKVEPLPEPKAIPIPVKEPKKPKHQEKKPVAQAVNKHPQVAPQQHHANYGQAPATQIPHATAPAPAPNNPVNVAGGDFGARFPWYVAQITRAVNNRWYRQEIDPHTPYGRTAKVIFTVTRDGSPINIHLSQSSGSPTLDSSAVRAVQRVDSFGPLPPQYNGNNVSVEYTFSYDQPNQ